jgi:Flp pilus assembly protein TadB
MVFSFIICGFFLLYFYFVFFYFFFYIWRIRRKPNENQKNQRNQRPNNLKIQKALRKTKKTKKNKKTKTTRRPSAETLHMGLPQMFRCSAQRLCTVPLCVLQTGIPLWAPQKSLHKGIVQSLCAEHLSICGRPMCRVSAEGLRVVLFFVFVVVFLLFLDFEVVRSLFFGCVGFPSVFFVFAKYKRTNKRTQNRDIK